MKFYSIIFFVLLLACNNSRPEIEITSPDLIDSVKSGDKLNVSSEINYSYEVFENKTNDWGYDILNNGKLFIHQPHQPSKQGNIGFKSSKDANVIAEFIIHKLENNIFPPSISTYELDSLGVL